MQQFNSRQLPPCPDWIPEARRKVWAGAWRELFRYWRVQADENKRFWMACLHAAGEVETEVRLGPVDEFSLVDY